MEIRASEILKKSYRKTQYLAISLSASMLAAVLIVESLIQADKDFSGYAQTASAFTVEVSLWALAVALLLLSVWLPHTMLKPKETPRGNAMDILMPQTRHKRMFQAMLISWALCDAVVMMGLGGFLLTGERTLFYTFWMLGVFFFILNFPSFRQWQVWGNEIGRMR